MECTICGNKFNENGDCESCDLLTRNYAIAQETKKWTLGDTHEPSFWRWMIVPLSLIFTYYILPFLISFFAWSVNILLYDFGFIGDQDPIFHGIVWTFQESSFAFLSICLPARIAPAKKETVLLFTFILFILYLMSSFFIGFEWQLEPSERYFIPKQLLIFNDLFSLLIGIFTYALFSNASPSSNIQMIREKVRDFLLILFVPFYNFLFVIGFVIGNAILFYSIFINCRIFLDMIGLGVNLLTLPICLLLILPIEILIPFYALFKFGNWEPFMLTFGPIFTGGVFLIFKNYLFGDSKNE